MKKPLIDLKCDLVSIYNGRFVYVVKMGQLASEGVKNLRSFPAQNFFLTLVPFDHSGPSGTNFFPVQKGCRRSNVQPAMGPFIKDVINRGGRGVCQKMILLNKLI